MQLADLVRWANIYQKHERKEDAQVIRTFFLSALQRDKGSGGNKKQTMKDLLPASVNTGLLNKRINTIV